MLHAVDKDDINYEFRPLFRSLLVERDDCQEVYFIVVLLAQASPFLGVVCPRGAISKVVKWWVASCKIVRSRDGMSLSALFFPSLFLS